MPETRIEVRPRAAANDGRIVQAAHQLGFPTLAACTHTRLFFVSGTLTEADAQRLAQQLLADPVTETYTLGVTPPAAGTHLVERTLLPGVTDPVADSLQHAAALLGLQIEQAATGDRYELHGDLTPAQIETLARGVLANTVIHRLSLGTPITAPFVAAQPPDATVDIIPVRGLDDAALLALSSERRLSLDIHEMRAIREYFADIQRDPTDAELEMLAQTWSEHCVHKTFRAKISYTGPAHGAPADSAPVEQNIDGLLKTYIRAATETLDKAWVRSAFVDNAGIVAFDDDFDVAFKVETHNRPSALEPFGGANTGAGGVIRDVLGVSARPIANTDVLCFGMPDTPAADLPDSVLHPRRIIDGVVHGIEDYGNKMGIPTVNGAVHYHAGYTANPLVFAGCVGLVPVGAHKANAQPGDYIVVIGGRTGRDGLRGATFSSMEMDTSTAQLSGGAVQIGHPINEKQVLEVVLRARDAGLYTAITDCGAGGLSSAVGEMGKDLGATVQLAEVPLKYPGLRPWEIWLSEAQERMVLAIPPANWDAFAAICAAHTVEAVHIGTFEPTGQLTLSYGDTIVSDISMTFLHDGIPRRELKAEWQYTPPAATPAPDKPAKAADMLLKLLAHPTIRSKADVIHRYDHEVGSGTAVKPLVGRGAGPGDASVIVPLDALREDGATKAIALSVGLCPQYTALDPYAMAWAAVDEAIRNAVAVGADPDQMSILDNFSWGNTQLPDRLGALVRCSQGCYDAALAYGTPFISGKDSLNNEYVDRAGVRRSIPGTLVISALGIVPDAQQTITSDFKNSGDLIYLIGATDADETGGSLYAELAGEEGRRVPQPPKNALAQYRALHQAIRAGVVTAAHDSSEGGLAVALAEMCIGGQLGAQVSLAPGNDDVQVLFAESQGCIVVTVAPEHEAAFLACFAALDRLPTPLGTVTQTPTLHIGAARAEAAIAYIDGLSVADMAQAWGDVAPLTPHPPLPRKRGEGAQQNHAPADAKLPRIERLQVPYHLQDTMQAIARNLRRVQTPSEAMLWEQLRNRQLDGKKFRRQQSVGLFVLDFYCPEEHLAVEVDGAIHAGQHEADQQRQQFLEGLGIRFVRLTVDEVETDIHAALAKIRSAFHANIAASQSSSPLAPLARERGLGGEGQTTSRKPILILHAAGTNRDRDAVLACELAGGTPEIVTVNQLVRGERHVSDYAMLVIPGGFSYGDDLGAGVLWALDLRERIPGIEAFVSAGKPVLGICNGFQTLVKSGFLPGSAWDTGSRSITLTYNELGRFECRWVELAANPNSPCLFTEGITDVIHAPIAHGEGRVMTADDATRQRMWADNLPALTYVGDGYPANPNGSIDAIAGLCNPAGNVFGLMPHPENHLFWWQHPQRHAGFTGLRLFENGIRRA